MSIVDIVYEKGIITRNQFEEIKEFCMAEGKANGSKATGRPKKPTPNDFVDVYYRWAFGGITLNQAVQELKMAKGTFYRILDEEGLLSKDDVRIKRGVDEVLAGIDGNKLVVSNNMSVDKATEVIKHAINYVGPRLRCANEMQTYDECICVYILHMWGEEAKRVKMSTSKLCEEVGISVKTYYENKNKIEKQGGKAYFEKVTNSIRLI